jgi:beta-aspartyl-peptidase (threonine type)
MNMIRFKKFFWAYPILAIAFFLFTQNLNAQVASDIVIIVHGGAGSVSPERMTPADSALRANDLSNALQAGYDLLQSGAGPEEAVVAVIEILENSPYFNAGRGAVFNAEGKHELDASIMRGSDLNAGAVAGVSTVKNPIHAALAVMNESPHVMLSGKGAEMFAEEMDLEKVENNYFDTPETLEYFQKVKSQMESSGSILRDAKYGTVGCVALDASGNLASGTSTGGMTYKQYGRIGDSPIIGAGTYADNATCGVSCTGHGEYFIRNAIAYQISAMMQYGGLSVQEAVDRAIYEVLTNAGAQGGVIALDRDGNAHWAFNTPGMYRGYITNEGEVHIEMYSLR